MAPNMLLFKNNGARIDFSSFIWRSHGARIDMNSISFFLVVKYFSGKFGRIRAKFLRTTKNLATPTLVVQAHN